MHRDRRNPEECVANSNNGGRNVALPDENQPSWRPQDDEPGLRGHPDDREYRGWQDRGYPDDDRYGDRRAAMRGTGYRSDRERATERYGQGQSGYGAGRRGEEPWQHVRRTPTAGSFEDRNYDLGVDDRFTGRGGYWQDRTGYDRDRHGAGYRGRDFGPERHGLAQGGPRDERLGYPAGSYNRASGGTARDAATEPRADRGTGPHRGKGPAGYQRSDERIREMVCESLTEDDQIDASHIEVAVSQGEVTLSGTVDDRQAKRDAEDCTWSVSGVRDVHNLLRIATLASGLRLPSAQSASGKSEGESADRKHRA